MRAENNDEDLISIIVPVYNTEKYLEQCLKSLINQTYKNIEIIVVNDGSTDQSLDILNKYSFKDNRIKLYSQKNQGISAARNTALEHINGKYIMFVDSDDWIEINTCETALHELKKNDSDIVMWAYKRDYLNSSKETCFMGMKSIRWKGKEVVNLWRRMIGPVGDELKLPQTVDSIITVWGKLYKREMLYNLQFTDTKIVGTEDTYFNIKLFLRANSVLYIPSSLYHYRKEEINSFTHLYKKEKISQWRELYKRIYKILQEQKRTEIYYEALRNRICLGLIGLGLNLIEDNRMTNIQKLKEIQSILHVSYYRDSLKELEIKYFPLHWKVFFICAKYQLSICLLVLLYIMNFMRRW